MTRIDTIISDSDGTLVDTVDLIRHGQYETARQYLTKHGINQSEIPDYETYNTYLTQSIGGSARDTLEHTMRLLYASTPHHLETMDFDELHSLLNPVQDQLAPEYIRPYEGLVRFFEEIGQAGMKLAIFTSGTPHHIIRNFGIAMPEVGLRDLYKDSSQTDENKLALFSEQLKKTFNIPAFTVITADHTKRHKPDPESLNLALHNLDTDANKSLVLGDHKVDMQTAVNAGIATRIGITHGFDDEATLRQHGATVIAHKLSDVTDYLRNNR